MPALVSETIDQAYIPPDLLRSVDRMVDRYDLAPDGRTALAYSGGEDSTFALGALGRIGVEVDPIIYADMGYVPGKGEQLRERLHQHNKELTVIDARYETAFEASSSVRVEIEQRFAALDVMEQAPLEESLDFFTPCTDCHSIKLRTFESVLAGLDLGTIALGYHRSDARASFVRNFVYTADFRGTTNLTAHPLYDRKNLFPVLAELGKVKRLMNEYPLDHPKLELLRYMKEWAEGGLIDTDEPVQGPLIHGQPNQEGSGPTMTIPLWEIDKYEIHQTVAEWPIEVEGSECGHGALTAKTPRELALELFEGPAGFTFSLFVDDAIRQGIAEDGTSRYDTRRNRHLLLPGYKPKRSGFDKL